MQKEELLHLHMLMVQIKKYYESVSGNTVPTAEYEALQISPIHIHKNKNLHRVALLTLGNEIVTEMNVHKSPRLHFPKSPVRASLQNTNSFPSNMDEHTIHREIISLIFASSDPD
ncbi:MAG TPA: UPF0058 family protein, partial [Methanocorpusculum sp.]|nr:UPF0058 family protein [Methanocorpusculum sp.]